MPVLLPGEVGKELLAGAVHLAHDHTLGTLPAPVVLAELGVLVPVRMAFQVLEVEQLQGDPGLAPLQVDPGTVGKGTKISDLLYA